MRTRSFNTLATKDVRSAPKFTADQWAEFRYRIRIWGFTIGLGENSGEGLFANLVSNGGAVGPEDEQHIQLYRDTAPETIEGAWGAMEINFDAAPYRVEKFWIPRIEIQVRSGDITATTRTDLPSYDVPSAFRGTILGVDAPPFYESGSAVLGGSVAINGSLWWERRKSDGTAPRWNALTGARIPDESGVLELP